MLNLYIKYFEYIVTNFNNLSYLSINEYYNNFSILLVLNILTVF